MAASGRRFLVIVRAGEKSLHRQWLEGGERNWDLVVSWYGREPYVPVADERVLTEPGWKWDVLARQIAAQPNLIAGYDHIWLPDDDIATEAAHINLLFDLSEKYRLDVSQPSLSGDSYFSHIHTVHARSFLLRFTTFVESMVPCMSRETLLKVLPHFASSPSGRGIDYVWARLGADNNQRAAVLDAVAVHHTRPVGRFLMSRMSEKGLAPKDEAEMILERFGAKDVRRQFFCYSGVGLDGRRRGRVSTMVHMLADYSLSAPSWVEPARWTKLRRAFQRVRYKSHITQLTPRPD